MVEEIAEDKIQLADAEYENFDSDLAIVVCNGCWTEDWYYYFVSVNAPDDDAASWTASLQDEPDGRLCEAEDMRNLFGQYIDQIPIRGATEENFREFWERAGFKTEMFDKDSADVDDEY